MWHPITSFVFRVVFGDTPNTAALSPTGHPCKVPPSHPMMSGTRHQFVPFGGVGIPLYEVLSRCSFTRFFSSKVPEARRAFQYTSPPRRDEPKPDPLSTLAPHVRPNSWKHAQAILLCSACDAIVYAYGRSVPSSPLLQCLHIYAFEMDYLSCDIDGHSFGRIVFGFLLRTLIFSLALPCLLPSRGRDPNNGKWS